MSEADQQSRALAFLRISIGLLFLLFAEYKLTSTKFIWGGMAQYIGQFLNQGSYPFIRPLLKNIILPHAAFFGAIVSVSELLIALSFLTGVLGPLGKSRRSDHDVALSLLLKLPRPTLPSLAVLRRLSRTLRSRPLLCCLPDRPSPAALDSSSPYSLRRSPVCPTKPCTFIVFLCINGLPREVLVYFLDCLLSPLVGFVRSSNNNYSGPEKL